VEVVSLHDRARSNLSDTVEVYDQKMNIRDRDAAMIRGVGGTFDQKMNIRVSQSMRMFKK
jgi:hypothetical protein